MTGNLKSWLIRLLSSHKTLPVLAHLGEPEGRNSANPTFQDFLSGGFRRLSFIEAPIQEILGNQVGILDPPNGFAEVQYNRDQFIYQLYQEILHNFWTDVQFGIFLWRSGIFCIFRHFTFSEDPSQSSIFAISENHLRCRECVRPISCIQNYFFCPGSPRKLLSYFSICQHDMFEVFFSQQLRTLFACLTNWSIK